MKIAVIGTGIAGMTAAYLLHDRHALTVYEAADRIGGHTHTVPVTLGDRTYPVDTGFIVFNDWTYPQFIALLARLGVASQPSSMSFSVRSDAADLEYNGASLATLFAQRRNLLRPSFYRMLADIVRFNRAATRLAQQAASDPHAPGPTVGEFLAAGGYGRGFIEQYLLPMGAAIWSAPIERMRSFPLRYFATFFHNHGMLSIDDRPQWRVVTGGSSTYARALTAPYRDRVRLGAAVVGVARDPAPDGGIVVQSRQADGSLTSERFDHAILACHGDQALALLAQPSAAERAILGAFSCQENLAVLHTDPRLLPRRRRAWASWNYYIPPTPRPTIVLTYHMNILQGLDAPESLLVTLNPPPELAADRVIRRIAYRHPLYTAAAVAAQTRHAEIDGVAGISYCGAYWGYGFHEDGVRSALAACRRFGVGLS
jgi:predicted NAD/FAD-binding protein